MSTHTNHLHDRKFVRTFFTTPTAVEGEDNSAKMLQRAVQLRGMEAPDVWVPDNEDATAPSMRDEGVENMIDVISEHGADFPGEIHPRVVWHRESPSARYQGFQRILALTDPENGAVEHLDGFVIPEVGDIDDWKRADEFLTIVENEHGLEEEGDRHIYDGDEVELEEAGEDRYMLRVGGDEWELAGEELAQELLDLASYIPSLNDIVDSMEEFEAAKEAGKGAIAMERSATLVIDGVEVEVSNDRMWDEATYQAAQTPISMFQDVYENRPDQHEDLKELYGEDIVERALVVG